MIAGYIADTCKAGQGPATCRYITMGADGWACAKLLPLLKATIDNKVSRGTMKAQGDNCPGVDDLEARSRNITTNARGVQFVEIPE